MMRLLVSGIGVLVAMCTMLGCQGSVSSGEARRNASSGKVDIVRNYTLIYSEDKNEVLFTANFKEGRGWASDVILESPASIHLNGVSLMENSKTDELDGGELAAFYGGFIFPLFWVFMGDNGYANYKLNLPGDQIDYNIHFVDPEGESHIDQVILPKALFSIPSSVPAGSNELSLRAQASSFDSTQCSLSYRENELREQTIIHEDGSEEVRKEQVTVQKNETYSLREGVKKINLEDIRRENIDDFVRVSCIATQSKSLSGGSGGNLSVSHQGSSHKVHIYN